MDSTPGKGSTFTLFLPVTYSGPLAAHEGDSEVRFAPFAEGEETTEQPAETEPASEAAVREPLPVAETAPPEKAPTWQGEDPLASAKILIVDDDIRNVFALTSVLERHGATVVYAENGREGIEQLERNEDVSLVLMDIMMPEMDGWATTSAIRRMPQFADLPSSR